MHRKWNRTARTGAHRILRTPARGATSAVALLSLSLIGAGSAHAQATEWINAVASFTTSSESNSEAAVTIDSAGNIYGTSMGPAGGGGGTLWKIPVNSGTPTILYTWPSGTAPSSSVTIDSSGNLYGTTIPTTGTGLGTVWKYTGSTMSTLASFNGTNGAIPLSPGPDVTIDSSSNLYGTTVDGGASSEGTVWKIAHGTTTITVLASFGGANGEAPQAGVTLDSSGNLYGTTNGGGVYGYGAIWKIAAGTTTLINLFSFDSYNGAYPYGNVTLDSSGNLYGTTTGDPDGTAPYGTVWKFGSSTLTTLYAFQNTGDGANPIGNVAFDSTGDLIGTTKNNILWECLNDGGFAVIGMLNGTSNGSGVYSGVTIASNGYIYGTAEGRGSGNDGTVWRAATMGTVANFNGTNGSLSDSALVRDSAGNLYGTTESGGANNNGSVFKIAAGSSTITTIASFNTTNGKTPVGDVALDSSGNIYGTAELGGSNSLGTVWKIASGSSTITTIANFTGTNGRHPSGNVTLDSSGNLYGTTSQGGASSDGNVWKVASGSSTITTIASFAGTNGTYPICGLRRDSSGNLYGVTSSGGADSDGTVWKIASGSSTITTLGTFNGTNGETPQGAVALDSSGNLYGTTAYGGSSGVGTIFKIASGTETITTLANFTGIAGGAYPAGDIVVDSSGDLYGVGYGGTAADGTVWELPSGGSLTLLGVFTTANGTEPIGGVVMTPDGFLWGTTYAGGSSSDGVVWKI
jgi:uncharacterized repeat protein (TIGR03803 family)